MRRQAKASSAGSITTIVRSMLRVGLPTALVCLVALAVAVPTAFAQKGTVSIIENTGSGVAVNESTGNLYVIGGSEYTGDHIEVYDSAENLLFEFGSPGDGAGQMGDVRGIAINQSTGDVYLVDQANKRVSRFDATGNFISTWGGDVDATNPSTGFEVCTAASGHTCKSGQAGRGKGELFPESGSAGASYVAISPDGRVYVTEPGYRRYDEVGDDVGYEGNRRIEMFSPAGDWLGEFKIDNPDDESCKTTTSKCIDAVEPRSIAIDSTGVIFTAPDSGLFLDSRVTYSIKKYTSSGNSLGSFGDALVTNRNPLQVAIDRSNGHVFIFQSSDNNVDYEVAEYDSSGKQIELWGVGVPVEPPFNAASSGLAVDSVRGRVYLAPGDGRVLVMDTITVPPDVTTSLPTGVTSSSAELHGAVNPNGTSSETGWHFEYRRQGNAIWTLSPESNVMVGNGTFEISVDHEITGLDPNTTYESRLVAQRQDGAGNGTSSVSIFTTDPALPELSLIAPTKVTDTTATLQAMINPKHSPTTYYFAYGTDTSYGLKAPSGEAGNAGSQLGRSGVFEPITGLLPGTTYHFRLIATNTAGPSESQDLSFTTHTIAEMEWPGRALQMVNQPDVANQVVNPGLSGARAPVSKDGSRVLWKTFAGAPGSTTGYQALYMSEVGPKGWSSRHMGVAAAEQPGEGDYAYVPKAASADLTGFAFTAESGAADELHPHILLRMNSLGAHEVIADLGEFGLIQQSLNVTSHATHVLYQDPVSQNLIDFHGGSSEVLQMPSCGYTLPSTSFPVLEAKRYSSEPNAERVFISSPGSDDCNLPPGVFLIDRSTATPTPVLISGPQTGSAELLRVNETGTAALFLKEGELYRWTAATGAQCLTCGELPNGIVIDQPVVSDDLSHVYFCNENKQSINACDVYVWREQGVSFVAATQITTGGPLYNVRVSPTGGTFIFESVLEGTTADPTGWNGSNLRIDQYQLYRYSDESGVVECVSCTGTSRVPDGGLRIGATSAVSADGRTVAFSTAASLLPEDINGRDDVYEWHNGLLRLVTDGETEFGTGGAVFGSPSVWGLSDDGRTLVFSAGARLTGNEVNPFANAYAAVVGGASFPPELPPSHCVEDACQGPLQAAPPLDSQASSAFHGSGNASERRAQRRKAKRHKKKNSQKNSRKNRRAKSNTAKRTSRGNG